MPCRGRRMMKHGFLTLAHAFAGGVDACEGRAPRRSAVPPSFGFPEGGEKRSGKKSGRQRQKSELQASQSGVFFSKTLLEELLLARM